MQSAGIAYLWTRHGVINHRPAIHFRACKLDEPPMSTNVTFVCINNIVRSQTTVRVNPSFHGTMV